MAEHLSRDYSAGMLAKILRNGWQTRFGDRGREKVESISHLSRLEHQRRHLRSTPAGNFHLGQLTIR